MPTLLETSLVDPQIAADLDRPAAEALGLPGAAYVSPEFYERERQTCFAAGWVAAAVASEIPESGDALARKVAGWNLLFVRDRNGEIRCFHNLCRHRGMAVLTEACSKLRSLQCPWHGWSYGLDGTLRSTPEFGGPGVHDTAGFERANAGLLPVRLARWFDFIFVNIDGQAESLEHYLTPLTERFRAYDGFAAYRHAHSWRHVYEGNWKIAVEGAIEDYHLPCLHPQITHGSKRADRSSVEIGGDCLYLVVSETAALANGRTPDGVVPLPRIQGITGADAQSTFFMNIFPTGVMGISPDGLYIGTWLPDGPERTELRFHFYFVGDAAARDAHYAASRERWIAMITDVFEQDTGVVKSVQEGARVRDQLGLRTRFSPFWETAVHRFQQHVWRLAGAAAGNPPACDRSPAR